MLILCVGKQIKPLVEVTRSITEVTNIQYEWHELFPHGL